MIEDIFRLFEGIAPGGLDDPEQALRALAPKLRFLVVQPVAKPTLAQLVALRVFCPGSNLVQLRKLLQAGTLEFGPFPGELAQHTYVQELVRHGLEVSLRVLTTPEQAEVLGPATDDEE